MSVVVPSRLAVALVMGALAVTACSPLRGHSGYIVDADLVNAVQPGTDTRQSVQTLLGRPTFTGQFDNADWYYLARNTKGYAFVTPKVSDQTTLRIAFDEDGTVRSVTRSDKTQIASIDPSGRKTPTLGREKSFFEELFGNIGAVGAPGLGGGQGGTSGDRP